MSVSRNRTLGFALAGAVFAADQWFKWLMMGPLQLPARKTIELASIFRLAWTQNPGISLGLLTADSHLARWALVAMTGAVALVVCIWLLREKRLADIVPLGLVLGGALGNIADRARFGFVVDYADLHFGEFHPFLVINLADAAITLGVLIILARSFLSREKRPDPEQTPGPSEPAPER
jgi:signal peptidase II